MISEHWLLPYLPDSGRTFLDVGANVGEWCVHLNRRFQMLHAIEPNPQCAAEICAACPQAHVHSWAAWRGTATLRFGRYASSIHTSAFERDAGNDCCGPKLADVMYQAFTIDSRLPLLDLDLMKVDVEGAEVAALEGAARLIQANRPRIIVEIHVLEAWIAIMRMLCDLGYAVTTVRHPGYALGSWQWHTHGWIVSDHASRVAGTGEQFIKPGTDRAYSSFDGK